MEHQVKKPKTRPGKRFLENREPKLIENDKKTIFIRGVNCNQTVLTAMKDFASLKKPNCVFFNRKNDIKPMENDTKLEFFCQKSDASLFMFGSHNKKRPNNLVAGRLFDYHVLDMFELGIEDFKSMKDFKTAKVPIGSKPMLLFTEGFEETLEHRRLKNFFIDFFRGPVVEYINLKGLEHLLVFSLVQGKILFRSYRTTLKKATESKAPSVELEEIGPHMNFVLRRHQLASEDLFKKACKKPKQLKPTKVKNMKRDTFGTTHGRIHMERQDYAKLQTRKLKGLKKRKSEAISDVPSKKPKIEET
ncbi:Ribosome production factor 2 [Araneus ventricosus]|uniref:Ribosome production factor 2 homolog n=1 Tax=Araneus ventricosus TaxID=182803 RepID=A0A4Y2IT54_ARAVE|nr:Ribosome production factor 2 [Araneus ventricosus]